ncbi:MAG: ABC transporter permease [bacterium]|nr:ABC transporter permease [bacterium]
MAFIPGNPVFSKIDRGLSQKELQVYSKEFDLKENFLQKFSTYIQRLVTLDFGTSLISGEDISSELWQRFRNTMKLALVGMLLFLSLGLGCGIVGAVYSGRWPDLLLRLLTSLLISTPVFWFGLVLMLIFAVHLSWLMPTGTDGWKALILPGLTVGLRPAAFLQRVTQTGLMQVFEQQYIQVAFAKGLTRFQVLWRHAVTNALIPIVTVVGIEFSSLLTGAVVAEIIFSYKGIGTYILQGIEARDYNVIMATVLVTCVAVSVTNFIIELMYRELDPRLKSA